MATGKIGSVGNFKKVNKDGAFMTFLPLLERVNADPVQALRERVVLREWHLAMGAKSNGVANVDSKHALNGFTQRDVRVATSMVLWLAADEGRDYMFKLYGSQQENGAPNWGRKLYADGLNHKIVPKCYVPNDADQKAIERMAAWLLTDKGFSFVNSVQKAFLEMGPALAAAYRP